MPAAVDIIPLLLSLIASLLALLVGLLAWLGNRLFRRMDQMESTLRASERALHGRLDEHGQRIARVEAARTVVCGVP